MARRARGSRRAGKGGGAAPPGEEFVLGGVRVDPGTTVRIEVGGVALPVGIPLPLTVLVARGARPGPRLFVTATIHGDELTGLLVVREVLESIRPETLRGTLVAVPIVNVIGLLHGTREMPDGRDLNRSFPGSPRGSPAARVAHVLLEEVVRRCTHGIDLHTAALHRTNLPQVRADLDLPGVRALAAAFGAPVAIDAKMRDGSLREAATSLGVPTLLYEAGEALRHDPEGFRVGVRGVLGVMAHLGMIPAAGKRPPATRFCGGSRWVRSPRSGYFIPSADLGDAVRKGEVIGTVHFRKQEFAGSASHLRVRAKGAGVVIGRRENPLVHEGDALLHVAHPA
jgi:uncharacterized protein